MHVPVHPQGRPADIGQGGEIGGGVACIPSAALGRMDAVRMGRVVGHDHQGQGAIILRNPSDQRGSSAAVQGSGVANGQEVTAALGRGG